MPGRRDELGLEGRRPETGSDLSGSALEPQELAGAARRVVDAIVEAGKGERAGELAAERESLSTALGEELSWRKFGALVAEVSAVAWAESSGREVEIPGPLQAVEAVQMRPGSEPVAVALEGLRQMAVGRGVGSRLEERSGGMCRELYEGFLRCFDPEARVRSSVHLTPRPLVKMLVRSVDELLRDRLGVSRGLGSPEVALLDPAAGTGAFLLEALQAAGTSQTSSSLNSVSARWQAYEVRAGAYVAATLRLARWTRRAETGAGRARAVELRLANALAEDSPLAAGIDGRGDSGPSTLVVVGNPPWSNTQVSSRWMERLLREGYRRRDGSVDDGFFRYQGRPVEGRNTKWIWAQYVQFLRLAQWCVDRAGRGVVGLVLSDGIADNLTFAGVRESLLGSFEEIFLLDLGGSSRKVPGEKGPDENVFGVRQGVFVLAMVKGGAGRGVFRAEIRGRRRDKLGWLDAHTVRSIRWQEIEPTGPAHSFRPRRSAQHPAAAEYASSPSVREIFEQGSVGVITGRDRVVVGFNAQELVGRIGLLRHGRNPSVVGLTPREDFDPDEALEELVDDGEWQRHLVPYLIRPGDRRVLFAAPYLVARPRSAVMDEIERPGNVGLLLPRRLRLFPSAWVTDCAASHRVASAYEGSYAFPLYVGADQRPNIAPHVLEEVAARYGSPLSPEGAFGYIYGQLWNSAFHDRHFDELRQDWPRVLFPGSFETFTTRADLGWRLARIHLGWEQTESRPWLHGELPVRLSERGRPFEHDGKERLYLGLEGGYLAPVGREVMAFEVGGYPVVPGWIRRRAGRRLGGGETEALCRLISGLEATRQIQNLLTGLEI